MFHTYVAYVLFGCLRMVVMVFRCFLSVSEACLCVSIAFRCMLQLLYLDISKVDRVLHLSSSPSAASSLTAPGGHPHDAAARSFRIGGAARPSSLIAWAARAPREARNGV